MSAGSRVRPPRTPGANSRAARLTSPAPLPIPSILLTPSTPPAPFAPPASPASPQARANQQADGPATQKGGRRISFTPHPAPLPSRNGAITPLPGCVGAAAHPKDTRRPPFPPRRRILGQKRAPEASTAPGPSPTPARTATARTAGRAPPRESPPRRGAHPGPSRSRPQDFVGRTWNCASRPRPPRARTGSESVAPPRGRRGCSGSWVRRRPRRLFRSGPGPGSAGRRLLRPFTLHCASFSLLRPLPLRYAPFPRTVKGEGA